MKIHNLFCGILLAISCVVGAYYGLNYSAYSNGVPFFAILVMPLLLGTFLIPTFSRVFVIFIAPIGFVWSYGLFLAAKNCFQANFIGYLMIVFCIVFLFMVILLIFLIILERDNQKKKRRLDFFFPRGNFEWTHP